MKEKRLSIRSSAAEFLVFEKQSHADSIEVVYKEDTLWMTQKMMGKLFDCSSENIIAHLRNITSKNSQVKYSFFSGDVISENNVLVTIATTFNIACI